MNFFDLEEKREKYFYLHLYELQSQNPFVLIVNQLPKDDGIGSRTNRENWGLFFDSPRYAIEMRQNSFLEVWYLNIHDLMEKEK